MKLALVAVALALLAACAPVQVSPQYKAEWTPGHAIIGPNGPPEDDPAVVAPARKR